MEKAKKIFRRTRQWGWVAIQAFALFALLFFPFLIKQKSNRVTHVIPSLSGRASSAPVAAATSNSFAAKEKSVTSVAFQSEVLQIQGPESDAWDGQTVIHSPFKQVRFEFLLDRGGESDRQPADEKEGQQGWFVTQFQRDLGDGLWEDLALIKDESERPVSSTFLEVGEQEQQFRVKFRRAESVDERVKSFVIVRTGTSSAARSN